MTSISKAWVVISDSAVDPDSPLDATLMTGIRDDLVHLREWLGASFTAGAIQDHDHDGANSKLIPVGPNYIRNPGFETDLGGWTETAYSGGTIARQTGAGNFSQGVASLGITSTVLANGGGDVLLNEFKPVSGGETYLFHVDIKASVGSVSSKAEVVWYDSAQSPVSTSTIYTSTATETSFVQKGHILTAPSTARYAKIKLTGGIPSSGAATGTIYFDNVFFGEEAVGNLATGSITFARSRPEEATSATSPTKLKEFVCPYAGVITTNFYLRASASTAFGRIYVNGVAAGTAQSTTSTTVVLFSEAITVAKGDLVSVYAYQSSGSETAYVSEFTLQANVAFAAPVVVGQW